MRNRVTDLGEGGAQHVPVPDQPLADTRQALEPLQLPTHVQQLHGPLGLPQDLCTRMGTTQVEVASNKG